MGTTTHIVIQDTAEIGDDGGDFSNGLTTTLKLC